MDNESQQDNVTTQGIDTERETLDVDISNDPQPGDLDPESLDPEYTYRWVYEGGNKIAKRLARGWNFVRKSEDTVEKLQPGGDKGDDFIHDGDTILMKIPRARHDAMRRRTAQLSRSRLSAPKGQFRKKAGERGVNVNTTKE